MSPPGLARLSHDLARPTTRSERAGRWYWRRRVFLALRGSCKPTKKNASFETITKLSSCAGTISGRSKGASRAGLQPRVDIGKVHEHIFDIPALLPLGMTALSIDRLWIGAQIRTHLFQAKALR